MMVWTWDADKARVNLAKHGIAFEAAVLVFDDPMLISLPDPHPDGDRWRAVGRVSAATLFVVHTIFDEGGDRIISARRATAGERKRYADSHA